MFRLLPEGFSNQDVREKIARLLVRPADQFTPGQMSYQLRRLRLRGLIERLEGTHRYRLTECGMRTALFYLCSHSRVIRPLASALSAPDQSLQQRILSQVRTLLQTASALKDAA
jgi:DNA-binding PadR family transcriptional regulator